jgi:hypothetical protein
MKISEICKTCKHYAYNWKNQPICCKDMNMYDYDGSVCGEYEKRDDPYEYY